MFKTKQRTSVVLDHLTAKYLDVLTREEKGDLITVVTQCERAWWMYTDTLRSRYDLEEMSLSYFVHMLLEQTPNTYRFITQDRRKSIRTFYEHSASIRKYGAILLNKDKTKAVGVRSVYGKAFYLPKGKIKVGETETDSIIREVAEETGYVIRPEQILKGRTWRQNRRCNNRCQEPMSYLIVTDLPDIPMKPQMKNEIAEVQWMPLHKLLKTAPSCVRHAVYQWLGQDPPSDADLSAATETASESVTPESLTPESVTPGSITPGSITPGSITPGSITPRCSTPNSITSNNLMAELPDCELLPCSEDAQILPASFERIARVSLPATLQSLARVSLMGSQTYTPSFHQGFHQGFQSNLQLTQTYSSVQTPTSSQNSPLSQDCRLHSGRFRFPSSASIRKWRAGSSEEPVQVAPTRQKESKDDFFESSDPFEDRLDSEHIDNLVTSCAIRKINFETTTKVGDQDIVAALDLHFAEM